MPDLEDVFRQIIREELAAVAPRVPDDEILKTASAAKLLHIGENELRNLCHAGIVPHIRLGNGFRFSKQTLFAWLRDTSGVYAPGPADKTPRAYTRG